MVTPTGPAQLPPAIRAVTRLLVGTDAFYSDRSIPIEFPGEWTVAIHAPRTPPPWSDVEIADALEHPAGQPPIRTLARGKARPLIIVDDLTRPTPVHRVMPFVLAHLAEAGIPANRVRILMATGTHGAPGRPDGMARKVGPDAASACQLLVHDHRRGSTRVGTTSFGTPIFVDKTVAASDLVIGIGGVYPHNMSSFGGGSKLALGVLAERSIYNLHYRHPRPSPDGPNSFRRDLDEVAAAVGMHTVISIHVDADRHVVRVVSGDARLHYAGSAAFSNDVFRAPAPGDVDVVVANAYPIDVNLTLAIFKGGTPFRYAAPHATRVLIATAGDGGGQHGLFPVLNIPRFHRARQLARRALVMDRRELASRVTGRLKNTVRRLVVRPSGGTQSPNGAAGPHGSTFLFRPTSEGATLPSVPGITVVTSWEEVLEGVRRDQRDRADIKVAVYPCAPLQCLDV